MNKRRLLKLADLLEADAKNKKGIRFDLRLWGDLPAIDELKTPATIPVDCETRACAIGLACISGTFKRSGLTYRIKPKSGDGNNFEPRYGRSKGFDAVQRFFDINEESAHFLFVGHGYAERCLPTTGASGERAVAKRIRDFVAGKAAP